MMKKTILLATALLVSSAFATQEVGKNYQDAAENVPAAFHNHVKESETPALNYVNQPPMIPHSVANYQVTKNTNQCLTCHSPENARITGATRISPTHFTDRNGNVTGQTAPRRYFCLHCHVPQADVEPIVPNEFKPMKGYGN